MAAEEKTVDMVLVDVTEVGWFKRPERPAGYVRVVPFMSEYRRFPALDRRPSPSAELVIAGEEKLSLLDGGSAGLTRGATKVPLASLGWLTVTAEGVVVQPLA